MHAMLPRYKFVIALSTNCKAERRLVDKVIEEYGSQVEILFLHVVVLPVGYLMLFDSQMEMVKRPFEKHIAPLLREHNIPHRLQFRQASNSMWQRQPPSVLIAHALCHDARAWAADALVVGGSGRQNCVRAALVGPRVSRLVLQDSASPVLLLGRNTSQSTLPGKPGYESKEHGAAMAA